LKLDQYFPEIVGNELTTNYAAQYPRRAKTRKSVSIRWAGYR